MGHAFALHASTDGDQWSLVRHFSLGLAPEAPVKLGVLAQSPHGEGCAARFTQLRYEERTLGDIRSGE
jgi:regulation of enolase protein 1 (concanavalin A-like superfamily)